MGLEARIDEIIYDANPLLEGWYFWEDGLNVMDHDTGQKIVEILNQHPEITAYAKLDRKQLQVVFMEAV